MNGNIGVEANLTPVKEYLSSKGYNVETINFDKDSSGNLDRFDACIMTGLNTNFMGITDRETKAIVIDASGMSPEQVYRELQTRLQ